MGGAGLVVWLSVVLMASAGEAADIDCGKLEIRFKTMMRRGTKNETDQWVRFNVLNYYCKRREGKVICGGNAFTRNHSVEERVWETQAETVEGVIVNGSLWDEWVWLESVFYVAEEKQTVFLEKKKQVFVVGENGTVERCQGEDEKVGRRIRECKGCEEELRRRTRTAEIRQKWREICKTQGTKEVAAKTSKQLTFVCGKKERGRKGSRRTAKASTAGRRTTRERTTRRETDGGGETAERSEERGRSGTVAAGLAGGGCAAVGLIMARRRGRGRKGGKQRWRRGKRGE